MTTAKTSRSAKSKRKAKRKALRTGAAPEPASGALPGPEENPREQQDLESVEDPFDDWPEEADAEEDRWLQERRGEDLEKPQE